MEITSLKLVNFRNFENLDLNFSSNKNIIIGNNGEGKTNIIESIFVLSLTKSFRTNNDENLINNNNNLYKIEGNIKSSFINNYKIIFQNHEKVLKINNNKIKRFSDYISNISVILFSINDLKLIKDTPNTRRKLINLEISELNNNYLKYLNIYNKILKQRNNYLRKINDSANYEYLSILDDQLIDYGLKIMNERKEFVENINSIISKIYFTLGGNIDLHIKYNSDFLDIGFEKIKDVYKKNLKRDIILGSTQFGVHKDDFLFYSLDKEFKNFASEGQQKSAIIAYKFAELEIFKEKKGENPILMLDDLFSELDIKRIEKILNHIPDDVQTFITTTDLKKIKKKYLKTTKIFEIKDGIVEESLYE